MKTKELQLEESDANINRLARDLKAEKSRVAKSEAALMKVAQQLQFLMERFANQGTLDLPVFMDDLDRLVQFLQPIVNPDAAKAARAAAKAKAASTRESTAPGGASGAIESRTPSDGNIPAAGAGTGAEAIAFGSTAPQNVLETDLIAAEANER